MQATDQKFIGFIGATERRYVIPIFQRRYTWEIKHCEQLLKDMLAVAESSLPCHFTGSVVWVREDDPVKGPSRMLLIDGQQRYPPFGSMYADKDHSYNRIPECARR